MIDTLIKWIIWPWWRPYIAYCYQCFYGGYSNWMVAWDIEDWINGIFEWSPIGFETEKEAHAWAFKHLTWRGKLKHD